MAIAAATEAAQGWLQAAAERGIEIDREPDGTETVTVEVAMPITVVAS